MKVWQWISLCTAIVLLAALPAGNALGASVSGRASTVFEWYDDAQEDTATPFYQYLQLNVRDIDGDGLNFRGYGRFADDLSDEVDVKSRLYFAYLEKKNILNNLDFKLGRQFISTTAGASLMDGLYLDYNGLGPLSVAVFGGGDVSYYEGYNAKDVIGGVEVSGKFFDDLHVSLSYLQKWANGDLGNELFGFDFDYDYDNMLSIYSETQFDYLSNCVSYFTFGAQYHKDSRWTLRAEYLYSLPVFSATSIYSVFAASEYEEAMLEYTYQLDVGLRAFGRYTREMYEDYSDANVYELGLEKIRTNRCAGYITGVYRDDEDGQDLRGFKVYGSYLLTSMFQAGLGVNLDVLERRLDDDADETTAKRYWADLTAYITKKVNVEAKVERVESDLYDYYNRGRVRLNILF